MTGNCKDKGNAEPHLIRIFQLSRNSPARLRAHHLAVHGYRVRKDAFGSKPSVQGVADVLGLSAHAVGRSDRELQKAGLLGAGKEVVEPPTGVFISRRLGTGEEDVWRNLIAYVDIPVPKAGSGLDFRHCALYARFRTQPRKRWHKSYLCQLIRCSSRDIDRLLGDLKTAGLFAFEQRTSLDPIRAVSLAPQQLPFVLKEERSATASNPPRSRIETCPFPVGSDGEYFLDSVRRIGYPPALAVEIATTALAKRLDRARFRHELNAVEARNDFDKYSHSGFLFRCRLEELRDRKPVFAPAGSMCDVARSGERKQDPQLSDSGEEDDDPFRDLTWQERREIGEIVGMTHGEVNVALSVYKNNNKIRPLDIYKVGRYILENAEAGKGLAEYLQAAECLWKKG